MGHMLRFSLSCYEIAPWQELLICLVCLQSIYGLAENISLGKLRPTTLPTIPIHNIIYFTGLTSPLIPPKIFCIASAELQGCTQKHGMSVNG